MARSWRKEYHVPWWYNERASLSLLAGAVWRMGGFALEEFSAKKKSRSPDAPGESHRWRGRIDLQFSYGGENFVAEAKQVWPKIGLQANSATDDIRKKMGRADEDALAAPPKWGKKLSIVFASPRFPKSGIAHERQLLDRWHHIYEGTECDAKAFFWLYDGEKIVDDGEVYPGAGIFIRQVDDPSFS